MVHSTRSSQNTINVYAILRISQYFEKMLIYIWKKKMGENDDVNIELLREFFNLRA